MSSIAVGIKTFSRTEKLEQLLESIDPQIFDVVYVADDGKMTQRKRNLYNRGFSFDLVILNLEYDSGLGYGRKKIVDNLTEEYILIVDNDMLIPNNVEILKDQLEMEPNLGGVSGYLLEGSRLIASTHDLHIKDDLLIRDIKDKKTIRMVAGAPLVLFDFIPNATMYRKACLEEYSWDENYKIGYEHLDFFMGQKQTNWKFAFSPTVVFPHYPGGDSSYLQKRQGKRRLHRSREYFLKKWDFDTILYIRGSWLQTHDVPENPIRSMARWILRGSRHMPTWVQKKMGSLKHLYTK